MHINVLYRVTKQKFETYRKYLPLISDERIKKIQRYHFDDDKVISLFTELFIREQISNDLKIPFKEISFSYNKYGKPYLNGFENYFFSVSHSKDMIAYASDSSPIGVDIQYMSQINLNICKLFFHSEEFDFIKKSTNPEVDFYKIWTAKEAYSKKTGMGLVSSFGSFCVLDNDFKSHILWRKFSDYAISLYLNDASSNANLFLKIHNF